MEVQIFSEEHLYEIGCRPMYWYNNITFERIPYYCNSPRCFRAECVKHWARKRLAKVNNLIMKYGLTRFFTLTVDRTMEKWEAWDMIATWWKKLRDKVRRWLEKLDMPPMKYVAVLEMHKDEFPHVHGFWNFFIPTHILSSMWSECAPGRIVWLEAVKDSEDASSYLTTGCGKYLGKDQSINAARAVRHRQRTFWRTHGMYTDYELDRQEPGLHNGEWQLIKKGASHGKKKRFRENMEGTCRPATTEGTSASSPDMEAEVSTYEPREDKASTESACENKHGDKERKREIRYGKEKKSENDTGGLFDREECIPDSSI